MMTLGNIVYLKPIEYEDFVKFIYGKFVGDKGNFLRDCSWTA